jgi:hypothetical protein
MIDIDYSNKEIKVTTQNLSKLYSANQFPLTVHFVNQVSENTVWSATLNDYCWYSYPNNEMIDVIVKDRVNTILLKHDWNVLAHGSYHYKSLYLYCNNITQYGGLPTGIAIGTHNGEFGEWVPVVLKNMTKSILVEASYKQFQDLQVKFSSKPYTILLNELVTPNGNVVEFFEGGAGYTNTIVERVIRNWEKEEIHSSTRFSISLNKLIERFIARKLDWLHLDVEGLDSKLIMSLEEKNIPNLIIFEDFNLFDHEKNEIYSWLSDKGFEKHSQDGICTAIRS